MSRGLQPGMQLIKVNSVDCTQKNQKVLVNEIQALNFIQIETMFDKDEFAIAFKTLFEIRLTKLLSNI